MIKLLIRIVVNAVAIWAAAVIVPGMSLAGNWWDWLIVGAVDKYLSAPGAVPLPDLYVDASGSP